MTGLAMALTGAVAGLGDGIVARADQAREDALSRLRRQWDQEDRQQDRDWRTSDRQEARGWALEDEARSNARADSIVDRSSNALRAVSGGTGSLFDLIDATEGAGNYDTLYSHSQRAGNPFAGVRVSEMTLDELAEFSSPRGEYGRWVASQTAEGDIATPMGRHQIVGTTLRNAAREMGLSGDTKFTPEVQDQIAMHLARGRLSGQSSMAGKRRALRLEWQGFRHVDDSDLDRAIAMFESGNDIYRTAVDPNVPSDVRQAITGQSGLGVRPPTSADNARPVNLSASLDARLRRRFVDSTGFQDEPDYETIDTLKEEITRIMQEEGLPESQAEQKAIGAMEFEEGSKIERQRDGFLGTRLGGSDAEVPDGNRTFTGNFIYNDAPAAGSNTGLGVRPQATPDATPAPAATPTSTTPPANDYSPEDVAGIVQQARDAIAAGADRAAVIARLIEMGIDPEGI